MFSWLAAAQLALLTLPTAIHCHPSPNLNSKDPIRLGPYQFSHGPDGIHVFSGQDEIWSSGSVWPFVSASVGDDIIRSSDGAFNITNVDTLKCQGQNISSVEFAPKANATLSASLQISGHLLECGPAVAPYTLTLWLPEHLNGHVAFNVDVQDASSPDVELNKVFFTLPSTQDEGIYGLGAQASFGSLKNQTVPIVTREQGVGRGDEPITSIENEDGGFHGGDEFTTYTANPSFITTNGGFFYLSELSTGYTTFDFKDSSSIELRYDSLSVEGGFGKTGDMFDAVEKLTEYTGRQPSLPEWVDHGAILGIQGGDEKVERIVKQGLDIDCPVAGVWLQDWVGTHSQPGPYYEVSRLNWNWEYNADLYPSWFEFVQHLRDEYNVRTLSYVNTFLTDMSDGDAPYRRNLFAEADEMRYFVWNTTSDSPAIISSGPGLEAGIVDITNPELRSWFAEIMRSQVWNGSVSGGMVDFGEYTPITADTSLLNMRRDAYYYHNRYPHDWAQFHRGIVEDLDREDEMVLFHRSASTGSARYTNLFWVGDQNVDWGVNDGLKSAITSQMHMGLTGYAQTHSDIGGYTTTLTYDDFNLTRSAEVLGRWGEMAAVASSVFRSHEGNVPEVNAQFYTNASTYAWFAYNARMFASLGPYRRHILTTESEPKGWPLLRAPVMYHPHDLRTREISYQSFYLGADLYVAPVVDAGVEELNVYLPGDSRRMYTHVWTKQTYQGGQDIRVPAPLGQPAVFVVDDAAECMEQLRPFLEFVEREKETEICM
ncbi:hypothetical protein MBLNU230_g6794t1 [Neophaeotheca triangularis]